MGSDQSSLATWLLGLIFQSTPPHGERQVTSLTLKSEIPISIHAPAWGATIMGRTNFHTVFHFNPRPRMGSDTPMRLPLQALSHFNPRPRMGSDTPMRLPLQALSHFNPRPRMGSDKRTMFRFPSSTYFNPRPRMRSDSFTITMPLDVVGISIHAPAWGATAAYGSVFPSVTNISIHAPAWGATPANSGIPGIFTFQSTPPHGERRLLFQHYGSSGIISIHAPAWGATAKT